MLTLILTAKLQRWFDEDDGDSENGDIDVHQDNCDVDGGSAASICPVAASQCCDKSVQYCAILLKLKRIRGTNFTVAILTNQALVNFSHTPGLPMMLNCRNP